MEYKIIEGGVAAPIGFLASGVYCGVKRAGYPSNTVAAGDILANETLQSEHKPDLAMIFSEQPCEAAAVFTQNLAQGAPVVVSREHIKNSKIRAVIANSGNANTCNSDGIEKANMMCKLTADALSIAEQEVVCASTGVIGNVLPIQPIAEGIPYLVKQLAKDGTPAARAIMTTDTVMKQIAVELPLPGGTVHIGAMTKGSGMIHPNMATMLAFITTDAAITKDMLQKALLAAVKDSFNMLSVDGDTSTNDTLCILANGMACNQLIDCESADYQCFAAAIKDICVKLARIMAKDGEGASKLVECHVSGAANDAMARKAAKAVICSPLVKAAMFGEDANCGRIMCAIGNSDPDIDITGVGVYYVSKKGKVEMCAGGLCLAFDEEKASEVLSDDEIMIEVTMKMGEYEATAFGCDLTYDYVKINGAYRT